MKLSIKSVFLAAIAALSGFVVLLGYFVDLGFLADLRLILVNWSIILAAVAVLVGIANLSRVHWNRIKKHQGDWFYSLVILISLLATVAVAFYFGPVSKPAMYIFNYLLLPVEMSLMALLAIILLMTVVNLLNKRLSGYSLLFIGVVILIILGSISIPWIQIPFLSGAKNWIAQTWAGAGVRGILLGVAMGTVAAGLRVLLGVDRPYGE